MSKLLIIFYLLFLSIYSKPIPIDYFKLKKNHKHSLFVARQTERIEDEIIDLIKVNTAGYEHTASQNITLIFKNNKTNYSRITGIDIFNNKSYLYIPLSCPNKGYNNSVLCLANFTYADSAIYYMKYVVYNFIPVKVVDNISFYIKKKKESNEVKLLKIDGEAFTEDSSLFKLLFNKYVYTKFFSDFYLTDIKSPFSAFHISYSFSRVNYNSSIDCIFNFKFVPTGTYYINYIYENKTYLTNITLTIKEKEILSENDLLDVYSNFKGNKGNQTAYFSFYGKSKDNTLAYIVLSDNFSRINVIQTFNCKIIDYDIIDRYDLRCNLNLEYVNEGKYSVSEYYINNQHYFTKRKIDIVVQ